MLKRGIALEAVYFSPRPLHPAGGANKVERLAGIACPAGLRLICMSSTLQSADGDNETHVPEDLTITVMCVALCSGWQGQQRVRRPWRRRLPASWGRWPARPWRAWRLSTALCPSPSAPLAGRLDKVEIMDLSRPDETTYDTSIEPYQDCYALICFSPSQNAADLGSGRGR